MPKVGSLRKKPVKENRKKKSIKTRGRNSYPETNGQELDSPPPPSPFMRIGSDGVVGSGAENKYKKTWPTRSDQGDVIVTEN